MIALACFYRTPRRRISLFLLVGATFGCPKTYGFRYTVWLRRWYLQVGSTLYIPSVRHCRVHLYGVPEIRYGFRRTLRRFKYKKSTRCCGHPLLCWHLPIFPARRHASIVGTTELNFCVRNGNRWTLCVNNTNYSLPQGSP